MVNPLPFKEKPKKFTLDETIIGVNLVTEYLELSSKDSTKASYRVDQLISGEVMNDDCGVQKQRESENICEIIEHLNVKCSVYSDDLVNDRFLVYCEDEERSVLKVMDVDFKKVICQDDVADQISGIFCFGLSSVYFTSTKQVYLRQIKSPKKATLAEAIREQSKQSTTDKTAQVYASLVLHLDSIDQFKSFCLCDPRQVDRSKLIAHLKQHCTVSSAFSHLDTLFQYLSEVNPLSDGYFFEELIFWISLIMDSKLGELLLENEETVRARMTQLQKAIAVQELFFKELDETAELILPHVIENGSKLRPKDHPDPWDAYSVQVIDL